MRSRLDTDVLAAIVRGSFVEQMPFPQVLRLLADIGVERYYADLVRGETTFYRGDGASERMHFPEHHNLTQPTARFDTDAVRDAIAASQRREITYPEFLRRIAAAGCAFYVVHVDGQRVIYSGRHGERRVEPFPSLT